VNKYVVSQFPRPVHARALNSKTFCGKDIDKTTLLATNGKEITCEMCLAQAEGMEG
jgi:hypothetical protein